MIFLPCSVTWKFLKKRKYLHLLVQKISADPSHSVEIQTNFFQFSNFQCLTLAQSYTLHCLRTRAVCPTLLSSMLVEVARSRRKVQKLRDQSQYISKKVRALQYWRWACGTCCKQYHMLFYIQMAVVSTAIFFLFSPSFSFFLEIKVQIYIYFHNKCQYINQSPPKP